MTYDTYASDQNGTQRYLNQIGETSLLSASEERALMARVKAGDADAHAQFVTANLRLVAAVAKKFMLRGLPYDDLVQLGNLGLLKAVEKFDLGAGTKFSTYAVWWIKQGIQRALDDQVRPIRLPVHLAESTRLLRKVFNGFDHIPSRQELADALGWPLTKVDTVLASGKDVRSLDAAIGDDGDPTCLADMISAPQNDFSAGVAHQQLRARLDAALHMLPERAAALLRYRYGLDDQDGTPHTLEATGQRFGMTRERARQIEFAAVKVLRETCADLRVYLEAI